MSQQDITLVLSTTTPKIAVSIQQDELQNISENTVSDIVISVVNAPKARIDEITPFYLAINKGAYETAVENGFPGTEQEWLASLVGNGIDSVVKTNTVGLVDTYTITFTDATTTTFTVTNGQDGENGLNGTNGVNGTNGTNGTNGVGIVSVVLTNTVGITKTYTITFTDSSTYSYDVIDGVDGIDGSDANVSQHELNYDHTLIPTTNEKAYWNSLESLAIAYAIAL